MANDNSDHQGEANTTLDGHPPVPQWSGRDASRADRSRGSHRQMKRRHQLCLAGTSFPIHCRFRASRYCRQADLHRGKGLFDVQARHKMLLVKQQHPDLDIRLVFSNAKARLYKGSPTTYAAWADRHGFPWAHKTIPEDWLHPKQGEDMSQNDKILDHLQKVGSISFLEAWTLYFVRPLTRRIKDSARINIISERRRDNNGHVTSATASSSDGGKEQHDERETNRTLSGTRCPDCGSNARASTMTVITTEYESAKRTRQRNPVAKELSGQMAGEPGQSRPPRFTPGHVSSDRSTTTERRNLREIRLPGYRLQGFASSGRNLSRQDWPPGRPED